MTTSYFDDQAATYFEPHVTDRRRISFDGSWMLEVDQPAGDFPDPPIAEMVIQRDLGACRARCDFGTGTFEFRPGQIGVVPPFAATKIVCENRHQIQVLAIPEARMLEWQSYEPGSEPIDLGPLHAGTFKNKLIECLLDRLWSESPTSSLSAQLYTDATLITLWAELRKQARLPGPCFARGGLAPWQTRRCIEYLNDHASENVGLDALAALVGLSPFHFARAFKQSVGVPPHRFQLNLRIARAKALLEATNAPVTEIAFDVGYESSQALARLFHREVGLSPSDYRRQRAGG
jgi:AraC family transcriptional regulator